MRNIREDWQSFTQCLRITGGGVELLHPPRVYVHVCVCVCARARFIEKSKHRKSLSSVLAMLHLLFSWQHGCWSLLPAVVLLFLFPLLLTCRVTVINPQRVTQQSFLYDSTLLLVFYLPVCLMPSDSFGLEC
mmetsp:Transcript_30398/g.59719  ORF Transcript_30398/g.59719 Transcript_30398/m.59719 type:complete len:132 (+) Transcript_30398:102-497(+)